MKYTVGEVLDYVAENDVKFIRLAFCDIFGTLKNISIMPSELPRAFEEGISFDASAIAGFMRVEESDLFLRPDPSTLVVLPWRPQQGRVVRMMCNIYHPDGRHFEGDGRWLLGECVSGLHQNGYDCRIGPECEFYLFKLDERGEPTQIPHDQGGYFDVAPFDKGENVRREICLTLEEMGICPESSHHEQGPGQNEIVFRHSDALEAADNLITFETVVRTIAARNGLYACLMPKPLMGKSGSGLHINMSLYQNGQNLFDEQNAQGFAIAQRFLAGILQHICEITVFLNPISNSYARFGGFEAPKYVTWSKQNRSQLVRIPAAKGTACRMELRSPDPLCNPYLAFLLLIQAGMEGVAQGLALSPPCDMDLFGASLDQTANLQTLPLTLGAACLLAQNSTFVKQNLPQSILQAYLQEKLEEACQHELCDDSRI